MSVYIGSVSIILSFLCFIGFLATDESLSEKYYCVLSCALFLIAAAICFK